MEEIMEFKITEAEAREMAKFEEEVGCDISAGPDWGVNLDRVMELALNRLDTSPEKLRQRGKFADFLNEQFGSVMSPEEIEEVATSFQMQIQERLVNKIAPVYDRR
jgi:hypothetical protein